LFERERAHRSGGRGRRSGERESQANSMLSAEPNAWLNLMTLGS